MVFRNHADYASFLHGKSGAQTWSGFDPGTLPGFLFDFQEHLVRWALRKGRAAIFASCGLGKTPILLAWAQKILERENRPVLIVTPLAVGAQTVREGDKFGITVKQSRDGSVKAGITVTNYERLHCFNPEDFIGVVCDESSAIKAWAGKRRKAVTRFLARMKYRLLCSATPAPNDFIELGTASEALGELNQTEMLTAFFRSSDKKRDSLFKEGDFWNRAKWFFKPHSEVPFWRWVCSWAMALRSPDDLGFDGSKFVLPPLSVQQHIVDFEYIPPGEMFPVVARTLREQREERSRSINQRCELVASLVKHNQQAICWCQYNPEGDLLEELIPDCVQVAGSDSDDDKESRLVDFALGNVRVLVSKTKIACWGLNLQNCGHQTFFPSHSYEQFHQALRRSWRFGRVGPVQADVVATQGEAGVTANLKKKQKQADQMFGNLVREMHDSAGMDVEEKHVQPLALPVWIQ